MIILCHQVLLDAIDSDPCEWVFSFWVVVVVVNDCLCIFCLGGSYRKAIQCGEGGVYEYV